jgi:hypothetical protein
MLKEAMLDRYIESKDGWPLRISTCPNQRTLYNFPMQSGGAAILHKCVWELCKAGIIPVMTLHDGILFEETDPEKIAHAREIMLAAGRDVLEGFEIGVDQDPELRDGARFRDKRPAAQEMWATVVLHTVGALSKDRAA